MDIGYIYPWSGLEGIWFVFVVAFAIWWVIVDHRIEALTSKSAVDIIGTTDRLKALLAERGG